MLIAVDHGNSDIKTPNVQFCSGLIRHRAKPPAEELIEYDGSYWTLSSNRIAYMRNKTADERFFVLTLFAIAKELIRSGELRALNQIDLAVGLPPEHYGDLREGFVQYFKRTGPINFSYNGTPITIVARHVFVYTQAFAAVAPQISQLVQEKRMFIIDIGGMTTDVLLLRSGAPDMDFCRSLENGIITMQNALIGKINARYDMTIEADHIDMVLQGKETILPWKVQQMILEAAQQHTDVILEKLRELKVDLNTTPAIFIGGGAILLRECLLNSPMVAKADFVLNAKANAIGYQMLAERKLKLMALNDT